MDLRTIMKTTCAKGLVDMRYSLKLFFFIVLLLISIGFAGCLNDRRANPPQSSSNGGQNTQGQSPPKENGEKILLDVPIISQKPELKSGCEVTSLAMLLKYAGIEVDKMTLAQKIKKDDTPLVHDESGNIKKWGDPNDGFVGDITGKDEGFGVYPNPMIELMEQYMPGRAVNLTNQPFESLLESVHKRRPVIVWLTIDFKPPKKYEEWEINGNMIKATLDEHAVLLVGYDKNYCYINNPFNGMKNQEIDKETFIKIWDIMGDMAISYK